MIRWNIVTENVSEDDFLRKKLRQKIGKLERHLKHFPPDTVHLHIALKRSPRKPLFTATLTLRIPSNILRSEKTSNDLIEAFGEAVKTLLRELERLKEKLRGASQWKRRERRPSLSAGFAPEPMAPGSGPQTARDVVAQWLEREQAALLRHVRRLLRQHELTGELPPGALDARAVVDETARQALAAPWEKPDDRTYRVWLYELARRELQRRLRAWREDARETAPVEPTIETAPDAAAARKDWLEHLQHAAQNWPAEERAVFELYFVEGFEPDEVAMLLKRSRKEVEMLIGAVQTRLRWEMTHETA